jgi:hypothetical protein
MTALPVASAAGSTTVVNNPPAPKRQRAAYRQFAGGGTAAPSGKPTAGSEARRRAAMILEVLAGVQTPSSAAQALGIGVPRYYLLEQQALAGLLAACEPRPHGRTVNSDRQIARLERELATCRRELGRQQALARAAQRVLGLKVATVPAVPAGKTSASPRGKAGNASHSQSATKKSRKRKPVVRALRAARVLQAGVLKTDSPGSAAVGEVQIPAGDAPPAGGGNHPAGPDAACFKTQGAQGG